MLRARKPGRHSRWALPAVLVICLACLVPAHGAVDLFTPPPPRHHNHHRHAARLGRPVPVSVSVSPTAPMTAVPASFFGLSTEYWSFPHWTSSMSLLERVLTLLKVPGNGPMVLRIGGDSADHSFWDPQSVPLPPWAFTLAPNWLRQARELVSTLHVKLILDLNLVTDTPAAAVQWARAAEAALPRGSIVAFEVGNEPDTYNWPDWLAATAGRRFVARALGTRPLPHAIGSASYVRAFRAYAAALRSVVAPGVKLAGPVLANPVRHGDWVGRLIRGADGKLGLVTIHRYPYSACARRGTHAFPTITRILSDTASHGQAQKLIPEIDTAHDADLPLRVTELNSVTCGGLPGISNTFATALWAPDTLFALARAGADGVNLHVRANTINAPFALTPSGLVARPLLYGLLLFTQALGPHARLVAVASHHPRTLDLGAWAVRVGPDTLHVLLIDKSQRSLRVSLLLPSTARARVERLLAPSAAATGGVTLGGRWLDADGRWQGTATAQRIAPADGRYALIMRRQSALLLTVRVPPGALGASAPPASRTHHSGARGRRLRTLG